MNLNELVGVIKNVAPTLGSMLGGPLGGLAVSLITSHLGISPGNINNILETIKSDSSALQKIKELELKHLVELEWISLQDRENARQREIEISKIPSVDRDKVPARIAFVFIGGYFILQILVAVLIYAKVVETEEIQPILQMLKDMSMAIMLILSYYYAASHGQK